MIKLSLLLILLFPLCAYAQTGKDCPVIKKRATDAILAQDYPLALTKLRAYKICDPSKAAQADSLIADVFNKIKRQRDSAIIARNEAVKQTGIARTEKARAEAAQRNAERQAYLAQLSAMSANISLLSRDNPTLAFRLACLAYEDDPSLENTAILNAIISDTTNRMFRFKLDNLFRSFAYDDQKNTWYGANELGVYEYDMRGRQINSATYIDFQANLMTVSYNARYTVAIADYYETLSLIRHADFSKKEIPWSAKSIKEMKWSRDGVYILLSEEGRLRVLDTLLNEVYRYEDSNMIAFDVSPGLNTIAVSNRKEVILYDPKNEIPVDTLPESDVNYLAFSGDGKKLYTVRAMDNIIKQWVPGLQQPLVFDSHAGKVISVSVKPGPQAGMDTILSTSDDGLSILWTEYGRIIRSMKHKVDPDNQKSSAVISTDGKKAMLRTEKGLNIWDLQFNSLGTIATHYSNWTVADIARDMAVLQLSGNKFRVITPDSVREIFLPEPNTLYDVSIIDGKDRFLLKGARNISILNISTGERKVLLEYENRYYNTAIGTDGHILCRIIDTIFHFNKDGVLLSRPKIASVNQAMCLLSGTADAMLVSGREAQRINISTGKIKAVWPRMDVLKGLYVRGMASCPSGKYIAVWSQYKTFLFDTAWRQLRAYDHFGITKVNFSENGDSLYLLGSGVEVRYTLEGLKNSKEIYQLTVADRIRYNVPGLMKKIVDKGDWTEFEACVSYYTTDYYSSLNEANIEQLNYLESQAHRFFQKNRNYYSMLDTRIRYINSLAGIASENEMEVLGKVLRKIIGRLEKEKKVLAALYTP